MPKIIDVGSPKPPTMGPKSNQKTTKKQRSEQNIDMRSSWSRLGAIFGHCRSPLEVNNCDMSMIFEKSYLFENLTFATCLEPLLGRCWANLASKMGPEKISKTIKKHIKCWTCLRSLFERKKTPNRHPLAKNLEQSPAFPVPPPDNLLS